MSIFDRDDDPPRLIAPESVLALYPPDREALFAYIRPLVTEDMLLTIAKCDYENGVSENFEELLRIRDGIDLDRPLQWHPNEVLELYRWGGSNGKHREKDGLIEGREVYVAHAFCCAALLRIPLHNENRTLFENNSLAPLLESCFQLGLPFVDRLPPLITWALENIPIWDQDVLYQALALWIVLARQETIADALVIEIGDWVLHANEDLLPWFLNNGAYREGMTLADLPHQTMQKKAWRRLANSIKARPTKQEQWEFLNRFTGTPDRR